MKQFAVLIVGFFFLFFSVGGTLVNAQTTSSINNHTASEEAKGKEILQRLQNKQISCQNLANDDYEKLGEYFMGQMAGSSHEAMNQMMQQMMGQNGEEQMHIALGKRSSGCDTNASFPSGYGLPMMWWMMGSAFAPWSFGGTKGGGNPMMGYGGWGGFGFGWVFMIIFWILIILGVVALVRYLGGTKQSSTDKDKTPLEILKERYAKGEINKKEFEEMKKDLA